MSRLVVCIHHFVLNLGLPSIWHALSCLSCQLNIMCGNLRFIISHCNIRYRTSTYSEDTCDTSRLYYTQKPSWKLLCNITATIFSTAEPNYFHFSYWERRSYWENLMKEDQRCDSSEMGRHYFADGGLIICPPLRCRANVMKPLPFATVSRMEVFRCEVIS